MATALQRRSVNRRVKAKVDKLILKYQYKKAELEEAQLIIADAMRDFRAAFEGIVKHLPEEQRKALMSTLDQKEEQQKRHEGQKKVQKREENVETEADSELKSLYREIAKETHPDKLLDLEDEALEKKTKLFQQASVASEANDWMALRDIAIELGIDPPPPSKKQIKLLEESIEKIGSEIKAIHNTVAWNWYHFDSDAMRHDYMNQYVKTFIE
ncbi:MAG: hypothetical protein CL398_03415 [Acidiferrobacteraceae bacterium]|nr:hypothetical protein [Acidiferrobacteraceae bacterium]